MGLVQPPGDRCNRCAIHALTPNDGAGGGGRTLGAAPRP